jgi:hypothetical protein
VTPGRGHAWSVAVAALDSAVAGAGLVVLSVVPLGEVPTAAARWFWIAGIGALAGAIGGVMIGLWVSYGSRGSHDARAR